MKQPELVLFVKFKSPLSLEEVMAVVNDRIEEFRAFNGLRQKYYLQEPATGEYAGLYLWDSREDFESYRDSELRKTIASAYQTEGDPRIQVFEVIEHLRE